jgi:hypothetical protein
MFISLWSAFNLSDRLWPGHHLVAAILGGVIGGLIAYPMLARLKLLSRNRNDPEHG